MTYVHGYSKYTEACFYLESIWQEKEHCSYIISIFPHGRVQWIKAVSPTRSILVKYPRLFRKTYHRIWTYVKIFTEQRMYEREIQGYLYSIRAYIMLLSSMVQFKKGIFQFWMSKWLKSRTVVIAFGFVFRFIFWHFSKL